MKSKTKQLVNELLKETDGNEPMPRLSSRSRSGEPAASVSLSRLDWSSILDILSEYAENEPDVEESVNKLYQAIHSQINAQPKPPNPRSGPDGVGRYRK